MIKNSNERTGLYIVTSEYFPMFAFNTHSKDFVYTLLVPQNSVINILGEFETNRASGFMFIYDGIFGGISSLLGTIRIS